jgi:hypothetical protein
LLLKHFCNDAMVSIIKWPPHLQLAQNKMEGGRNISTEHKLIAMEHEKDKNVDVQ